MVFSLMFARKLNVAITHWLTINIIKWYNGNNHTVNKLQLAKLKTHDSS